MQNIAMRRDGTKLVIEIDLTSDFGPSASGKTVIVASSRGNVAVPGSPDTFVGLNCFRYLSPKPANAGRNGGPTAATR